MNPHTTNLLALAAAALFLSGCPHNRYSLRLSPDKGGWKRELTVEGVEQKVPKDELRALKTAYRLDPRRVAKRTYRVAGRFDSSMPDDIGGGVGGFFEAASPWGRALVYFETFRGSDDPYEQIAARMATVDRVVDLAIGWARHELGDGDEADALLRFLDGKLRRDLKSRTIYDWLAWNAAVSSGSLYPVANGPGAAADPSPFDDGVRASRRMAGEGVRLLQERFLARRGYPPFGESPFLSAPVQDEEWLYRMLVPDGEAGIDERSEVARTLRRLLVEERGDDLERSITAYVMGTPEFRAFARSFGGEERDDDNLVGEYLAELGVAQTLFSISDDGTEDELEVELVSGHEPVETNGRWDAASGTVRWAGRIDRRAAAGLPYGHLPDICYARWAEPDRAAQERQFGRVAIEGPVLFEYVEFCSSLTEAEHAEWDHFAAALDAAGIDRLLKFRFSGEEKPAVRTRDALGRLYEAISGKNLPDAIE
ncbi:MAG TPA: hypothetical protein VM285_05080 [Polyangia bacterium]|nr:hypothetical protein [Polyangia bacterium]